MALIDIDSWITEYEACERLSDNIQSLIAQRDRESKLTEIYTKISADIRIRLKQFSTELIQLKSKLNISDQLKNITPDELERRQRQVEILQSRLQYLQNKFHNVVGSNISERNELLKPSVASKLWEEDSDDDDIPIMETTNSYNVEELKRQQIKILEDQNQGLETLSQTISRQKELASRLGQEVEEQNDILDNLADNMERVDTRINSETQHIGIVTQKDKTCGYWIVIISLFIAIIIVAAI